MATFTWEVSAELHITPGQAVIMDIAPLVGVPAYPHMAPSKPTRASARGGCPACTALRDRRARALALTMREKPGGAVTGTLLAIKRKLADVRPEARADARWLELRVGIVGVTGDFVLPEPDAGAMPPSLLVAMPRRKLLWIAGGIGL
ncbi:hypothetical protein B0H10DRAFT_2134430, partial [Mycena sp. CBHHK59/15]